MSDRGSGSADALVPLARKSNARSDANDDPLEKAGHLILDMVRQAAGHSQADYQQAVETSRELSAQLRGAEERNGSLRQNCAIRRTGRIGRRSGCIISQSKLRTNSSVEIKRRHVAEKIDIGAHWTHEASGFRSAVLSAVEPTGKRRCAVAPKFNHAS
jgi:hypothetical protein